ncbi:MAG: hypothetical protein AB7P99_19100 [Vicinamibacterales bacterium]
MSLRHVFAALVAAAAASSLAVAQDTRPLEPAADRHPVTITGCFRSGILIPERGTSGNTAGLLGLSEFRLEGDRAALRVLRDEHDNHVEEVTGHVELPRTRRNDVGIATREVGPGRLTVGRRTSGQLAEDADAPRIGRLRIQEVKHLSDRC